MAFSLPDYIDYSSYPTTPRDGQENNSSTTTTNDDNFTNFLDDPKKWFNSKMKDRWFSFAETFPVRTTFITWNVAESSPSSVKTDQLFDDAEMFVVVLEEIDMSLIAFVTDGKTELVSEWKNVLEAGLPNNKYECIVSHQYGGLAMFIFIKESIKSLINKLFVSTVAVGKLGIANKGGIGVSIQLGVCKMLFVGAHLSANMGPSKCDEDYEIISSQLQFPTPIQDHDYQVWLGDFNYRLDSTPEHIREHLDDIHVLMKSDQLSKSMSQSRAFFGFIEAPILFKPTYRMIKGSDEYDWKRSPAWCDRVLFLVQHTYKVSIHLYERVELHYSDHIPVRCCASLKPRVINNDLLKKAWQDVLQLSNTITSEFLPKCSLSTRKLLFGTVQPYKILKQTFSINNIGKIPIVYSINTIDASNGSKIELPWLQLSVKEGVMTIGEMVDVHVKINMNAQNVKSLKENKIVIIEIQVIEGSVYYIEVDYSICKTTFGLSPNELINESQPLSDTDIHDLPIQSKLPKEFLLFIMALSNFKTSTEIFTTVPSPEYFDIYSMIFEHVDNVKELNDFDVCRISEAFWLFIRASGGLLPITMIDDNSKIDDVCSGSNKQFIRVVCALCYEISKSSSTERSIEELLTYIASSFVQKKLESNECAKIVKKLKNYALTVKSVEEELKND
ncbi:Inositol polyphosphate 5-phosphatase [Entamoeba marina]